MVLMPIQFPNKILNFRSLCYIYRAALCNFAESVRPVSFDFSFCVHEKTSPAFIHSSLKPQRARMSLISAQNLFPKRLSVIILVFFFVTKSLVIGQKMNYEMCANSLPRPGPTQGPEYDCLPRDVLVKLDLPAGSSHVAPDHVTVKRCGGSCHFDR